MLYGKWKERKEGRKNHTCNLFLSPNSHFHHAHVHLFSGIFILPTGLGNTVNQEVNIRSLGLYSFCVF